MITFKSDILRSPFFTLHSSFFILKILHLLVSIRLRSINVLRLIPYKGIRIVGLIR